MPCGYRVTRGRGGGVAPLLVLVGATSVFYTAPVRRCCCRWCWCCCTDTGSGMSAMISRCRAGEGNAKVNGKNHEKVASWQKMMNYVKNPGMASRHPLATPGIFSPIPPKKILLNAFLPLIRLFHLIIVWFQIRLIFSSFLKKGLHFGADGYWVPSTKATGDAIREDSSYTRVSAGSTAFYSFYAGRCPVRRLSKRASPVVSKFII